MLNRTTKLRWRRIFKRSQHNLENITLDLEKNTEKYFLARLPRLNNVKRFVASWVMLMVLLGFGVILQIKALSPYYLTLKPVSGGIYTEGIIGRYTSSNPIYASGSVDSSVSKLIFSSLLKFNSQNELVGDLAKEVKSDDRGIEYTVTLKDDLFWQDGVVLTADDVIFTYKTIQEPDAKSPLQNNWSGVKLEKIDDKTIKFTLPHALASFRQLLTNGIIPKHKLENIPIAQLRTADFNTVKPVGSGPFKWDSIQISGQTPETREEQIGLSANKHYYGGEPNLDKFIIKAIHNKDRLIEQFEKQEIDAMVGLDSRPTEIGQESTIKEYSITLNAQVMVFFKTNQEILKEKPVRQALTKATNLVEIQTSLGYPVVISNSLLLKSDLGYSKDDVQAKYDLAEANNILDKEGWVKGADGIREKAGVKLQFGLTSQNNSEYANISKLLQKQWKAVGVDLKVNLEDDMALQSTLALHNYDSLLYGITVGDDPDVYAYWHSSQADVRSSSRLNFSELKSSAVDSALEAGRTRVDPNLRITKYRPLLTAWSDEAPAIALYQPRFLYITRGKIYGLETKSMNTTTDRYSNVHNWRIKTEHTIIK